MSGETKGSDGHVKTVDRQVQLAAEADVDSEQVYPTPLTSSPCALMEGRRGVNHHSSNAGVGQPRR